MTGLPTMDKEQHAEFAEKGYVRLGKALNAEELEALRGRIDAIMLGQIPYANMSFQLDGKTGAYRDVPPESAGHKGATLQYRKIMGLEQDPLFLAYMQKPLFRQLTQRYIGPEVSIFRAMFMNKPAHQGSELPWHQDVGEGWGLDANPTITVWTALDAATREKGCMQLVPGSHQLGVVNPQHFLSAEDQARCAPPERVVYLEAEAGEAVLLHNLLLHRSGTNTTDQPRRAFSAAYMDAATRAVATGRAFPVIFGQGALRPASP